MSARAWLARRDVDAAPMQRARALYHRREVLDAAACPYWRHEALGQPFGTCRSGCWEVPVCMDAGPAQGRRVRRWLRRAGLLR